MHKDKVQAVEESISAASSPLWRNLRRRYLHPLCGVYLFFGLMSAVAGNWLILAFFGGLGTVLLGFILILDWLTNFSAITKCFPRHMRLDNRTLTITDPTTVRTFPVEELTWRIGRVRDTPDIYILEDREAIIFESPSNYGTRVFTCGMTEETRSMWVHSLEVIGVREHDGVSHFARSVRAVGLGIVLFAAFMAAFAWHLAVGLALCLCVTVKLAVNEMRTRPYPRALTVFNRTTIAGMFGAISALIVAAVGLGAVGAIVIGLVSGITVLVVLYCVRLSPISNMRERSVNEANE